MARAFLGLCLALLLTACANSARKDATIVVPQGSSLWAAARLMEKQGVIDSASAFVRHSKIFGGSEPIKPGEYRIKAGMSAGDILEIMQSGKTLQRFVIIPPGMPSVMVQERLMAADFLTGPVAIPEEGTILPDSYAYTRGESRARVMARMQAAMKDAIAAAWADRKPTAVVRTPEEAIILAGIVEKETSKESERRTVAGVYSNRLRIGMKLQADPTTIYPVTRGKPLGRRILASELRANNGYNTYAKTGLPIGPITNPSRASIEAVLDPETTSYLFFVADGTGGHIFARTGAEHGVNVRNWYAIRRQRGEM
jgi:UPF0755 protein